jgi:hypothetical protein
MSILQKTRLVVTTNTKRLTPKVKNQIMKQQRTKLAMPYSLALKALEALEAQKVIEAVQSVEEKHYTYVIVS